jgi:polyisoprenoid-binding protein YceI
MSTTKWSIDPSHSEVYFKAKHLMITNVTGSFGKFESEIETDSEDFTQSKIKFKIHVDSINTAMEMRDNHLKSDDFFNVQKFPFITFNSNSLVRKSGNLFELNGDLTIRDVTRTISLEAEFTGNVIDPYGNYKSGWEVKGKINRKEFNLLWHAATEAGNIVVSDDIKIEANVQYVKNKVEASV